MSNLRSISERFEQNEAPDRAFHIVVVDDDPAIVRLVSRRLRREGYLVTECATGVDARRVLTTVDWDLVILDRRLPDADGAQLCAEIRSNRALARRYAVILTADADSAAKIEGFRLGADDYVTKPFNIEELVARIRAGKRIVELQNQLIESNSRLELLSRTDGLTGLANRRAFHDEISRALEHAGRYERPLSLAMIDIDFFKSINDTYGHLIGDDVLRHISSLMAKSVRTSDTVSRYGGEEFTVLLPEADLPEATQFAEKMRMLVAGTPAIMGPLKISTTVSVGVASYPHTRFACTNEMISAADAALYRAKAKGRNSTAAERRRDTRRGGLMVAQA